MLIQRVTGIAILFLAHGATRMITGEPVSIDRGYDIIG